MVLFTRIACFPHKRGEQLPLPAYNLFILNISSLEMRPPPPHILSLRLLFSCMQSKKCAI